MPFQSENQAKTTKVRFQKHLCKARQHLFSFFTRLDNTRYSLDFLKKEIAAVTLPSHVVHHSSDRSLKNLLQIYLSMIKNIIVTTSASRVSCFRHEPFSRIAAAMAISMSPPLKFFMLNTSRCSFKQDKSLSTVGQSSNMASTPSSSDVASFL